MHYCYKTCTQGTQYYHRLHITFISIKVCILNEKRITRQNMVHTQSSAEFECRNHYKLQ